MYQSVYTRLKNLAEIKAYKEAYLSRLHSFYMMCDIRRDPWTGR